MKMRNFDAQKITGGCPARAPLPKESPSGCPVPASFAGTGIFAGCAVPRITNSTVPPAVWQRIAQRFNRGSRQAPPLRLLGDFLTGGTLPREPEPGRWQSTHTFNPAGRQVFRVRITDLRTEPVVDLTNIPEASPLWIGLDHDDSVLFHRDRGGHELYALALQPST